MGFFSWRTQDTDKSICNSYSGKNLFTVYMIDNKDHVWKESEYEGYGEFGGKDFYELLAEMNGFRTREQGIKIAFGDRSHLQPNLVEYPQAWINSAPENCEFQGYFYDE